MTKEQILEELSISNKPVGIPEREIDMMFAYQLLNADEYQLRKLQRGNLPEEQLSMRSRQDTEKEIMEWCYLHDLRAYYDEEGRHWIFSNNPVGVPDSNAGYKTFAIRVAEMLRMQLGREPTPVELQSIRFSSPSPEAIHYDVHYLDFTIGAVNKNTWPYS